MKGAELPSNILLELKNDREVLICKLLAGGYKKSEVARVLGISRTRMSEFTKRLQDRIYEY